MHLDDLLSESKRVKHSLQIIWKQVTEKHVNKGSKNKFEVNRLDIEQQPRELFSVPCTSVRFAAKWIFFEIVRSEKMK